MTTMRARIGKLTTGDLIGEPPVRRHVDEREARQVAEAARQTEWYQPSFAKELYLGRFDLGAPVPAPLRTVAGREGEVLPHGVAEQERVLEHEPDLVGLRSASQEIGLELAPHRVERGRLHRTHVDEPPASGREDLRRLPDRR